MSNGDLLPKQSPTPLHQLVYVLQHKLDNLLSSRLGVGFGQARIMGALHSSVPCSQRSIASRLGQTEANVSRQLKLLKRQGLVSILRSPKDARQRDVTLTMKGDRLSKQADKLLRSQHKQMLKFLSASELAGFNKAVSHLLSAFSEEARKS